jgi:hypothetical protein
MMQFFQYIDAIHTAGTLESWHEGELQHLPWPTQSPDLETRVRSRFPSPASLKQLEDVLQEEWYKIPLETVQNLYESIPRTTVVLNAKVVEHHLTKEMCIVSVVFALFCPTLACSLINDIRIHTVIFQQRIRCLMFMEHMLEIDEGAQYQLPRSKKEIAPAV